MGRYQGYAGLLVVITLLLISSNSIKSMLDCRSNNVPISLDKSKQKRPKKINSPKMDFKFVFFRWFNKHVLNFKNKILGPDCGCFLKIAKNKDKNANGIANFVFVVIIDVIYTTNLFSF